MGKTAAGILGSVVLLTALGIGAGCKKAEDRTADVLTGHTWEVAFRYRLKQPLGVGGSPCDSETVFQFGTDGTLTCSYTDSCRQQNPTRTKPSTRQWSLDAENHTLTISRCPTCKEVYLILDLNDSVLRYRPQGIAGGISPYEYGFRARR